MYMAASTRRFFLSGSAATLASVSAARLLAQSSANRAANSVAIGVMGLNGRGKTLAAEFAKQANVRVAAVCDVDSRALSAGSQVVQDAGQAKPDEFVDLRKMLESKSIDAVIVAAPNHWHAPAAILACKAGKHVYVEKPLSHTPHEGEVAVLAARKYDRVVQMGAQRRSWPAIREGIERLRAGELGRVLYSRGWYNSRRGSIGKGSEAPPPTWLNYELWQGPATETPYRNNFLHYHWHWFWRWGNGELGNNGIHALDLCRWGLGVDFPSRVVSGGGKYRWKDDQETPDTHTVTFDFGEKAIHWEGVSWSALGFEHSQFGASFHGERGSMVMTDGGYAILDLQNKQREKRTGEESLSVHLADFLASIRDGRRPNADVDEAHKSTLLCHLGNMAYRTGSTLNLDSMNGRPQHNSAAEALWTKEYRAGWEPTVNG
jgi:predicted dehydrogenase